MAFDFGATYKWNDDWTFSASLLDLGFSVERYSTKVPMSNSFEFDGFHEIPVEDTDGNPNSIDNQVDSYLDDLEGLQNLQKKVKA